MRRTILYPRFEHPAIEERYGSWQAQLFLRRAVPGAQWVTYDSLADAAARVEGEHCLVVTDPLLLVGEGLVELLAAALTPDVVAAIPTSNVPALPAQAASDLEPYLTIRQFQDAAAERAQRPTATTKVTWQGDPGIYLTTKAHLGNLDGQRVAIATNAYVHRWTQLRAQPRTDLLPLIPTTAHNILEFGCAEGLLGETIKARQACRFVGIEIDPVAAAAAEKRLDRVYRDDATTLVTTLDERFDCVIGGDVLEHLGDPWSFLANLRELAEVGGVLLLSIPNVANWAIVSDLLRGRFDYAYMAIACAGHLRFFSRNTIADALEIAGWTVESIEPQAPIVNGQTAALLEQLRQSGIPHDTADLLPTGFYVTARKRA